MQEKHRESDRSRITSGLTPCPGAASVQQAAVSTPDKGHHTHVGEKHRKSDHSRITSGLTPFPVAPSVKQASVSTPDEGHAPIVQPSPEPMQLGGATLTPAERRF